MYITILIKKLKKVFSWRLDPDPIITRRSDPGKTHPDPKPCLTNFGLGICRALFSLLILEFSNFGKEKGVRFSISTISLIKEKIQIVKMKEVSLIFVKALLYKHLLEFKKTDAMIYRVLCKVVN